MAFERLPAPLGADCSTLTLSPEMLSFVGAARAASTWRAYRRDWADFCAFCRQCGATPCPATPLAVASYLAYLAGPRGLTVATIVRRVAAIAVAHHLAGVPSPTGDQLVREELQGIRRVLGSRPKKAEPLLLTELRRAVRALPETLPGCRDRALLLVGFAGALRRSELVALTVDALTWSTAGVTVLIRRSKTDQEGAGRELAIPYGRDPECCPVVALRHWLTLRGTTPGPLFVGLTPHGRAVTSRALSTMAVNRIVKAAVTRIGLDPSRFSGHSLRAGFATSAAEAGVPLHRIMTQTRHRSERVLLGYIRDGTRFIDHPLQQMGL